MDRLIERKQMSTKTTFKRIAFVTVAALGLGVLTSVAPASAVPGDGAIAITAGTNTGSSTAALVATSAGTNNFIGFTIDTIGTAYAVKVTGGTASSSSANVTGSGTASLVAQSSAGLSIFTVPTPTAGTITVKTYAFAAGVEQTAVTSTLTITVNGPAAGLSATLSTAQICSSSTAGTYPDAICASATKDDAVLASSTLTNASFGTQKARITVKLKNTAGETLTGTLPAIGASITGPGTLSFGTFASAGRYLTETAAPNDTYYVNVFSDGTAGTATISLLVGGAVWKTKTITFYGAPTTLVASQNHKVLKAGTTTGTLCGTGAANPTNCDGESIATSYAVQVLATDALGNPVPGLVYTAIPDATVIIDSDATTTGDADADSLGATWFDVATAADAASGKTGTVSYKTTGGALGTTILTSNALTFAIGGAPVSVSVALGASANSEIGAKNSLVFTDKDAAGNAPYDLDVPLALTSNVALVVGSAGGATNGLPSTIAMVNGSGSVTFYNPSIQGNVTISGTAGGTLALPVTITIPVTSALADATTAAAEEAVAAANDATDAALSAAEAAEAATALAQEAVDAVAELSAQVTKLISALRAQITSLTNLIIKIQKKLKA